MIHYVYLGAAIVSEVFGTTELKQSNAFTRPIPSMLAVVAYAIALYLLSLTMRELPTGIVYAIWSGVGIVLISAISWFVYDQALDVPALIGISLIMAGVIVVNVFSKSSAN